MRKQKVQIPARRTYKLGLTDLANFGGIERHASFCTLAERLVHGHWMYKSQISIVFLRGTDLRNNDVTRVPLDSSF